jgi:hypothetical protein
MDIKISKTVIFIFTLLIGSIVLYRIGLVTWNEISIAIYAACEFSDIQKIKMWGKKYDWRRKTVALVQKSVWIHELPVRGLTLWIRSLGWEVNILHFLECNLGANFPFVKSQHVISLQIF